MNKENKVVHRQQKIQIVPPQSVRSRNYSVPNKCNQFIKKRLASDNSLPETNVTKRIALCDLQPNTSNAPNLQRWITKRNSLDKSHDNKYEKDDKSAHLQTSDGLLLETNSTASTYNCTLDKTPIYTSLLEAGPLQCKTYFLNRKYVTERNSPLPISGKREYDESEDDEVFVDAQQVFGKMSPIPKNSYTSENTILVPEVATRVLRKNSLVQKRSRIKILNSHCEYDDIYVRDYLEDGINYLLDNDLKYVVTVSMLKSRKINVQARATVIDWLLKIQISYRLPSETYLKSVRLFDCVLCSTEVPINMYQLAAITSFWIFAKYDEKQVYLSIRRILSLLGGVYRADQLIAMEFKFLNYMKCNCNVAEPIAFMEYYIHRLQITNKDVRHASYYVLEAFALSPYFSTAPSSLLAASAVYLSLECIGEDKNVWERMQGCRAYYHVTHIDQLRSRMQKLMERIGTKNFPYLECYKKYSTEEMNFIVFALSKSELC